MPENVKPSQAEEEYFAKEEAERKRRLALKAQAEMADAEKRRLKDLHYMHCPKCGQMLQEVTLRGVPVDVCFSCNGVFLDQGELETFQRQIAAGKRGVVAAILNWFGPEGAPPKAK
jgi:hypothetical protein